MGLLLILMDPKSLDKILLLKNLQYIYNPYLKNKN